MIEMIAVTGAAGKTGLAIIHALAQRGQNLRGLVHRASDQAKVLSSGAIECVVGDLEGSETLEKLLSGVVALYHICPNMHPRELEIGKQLLTIGRACGVTHVVYHSVLHPQIEAMPHHWQKMLVEEQIFACGLPFTILQPTAYMQNLAAYWQAMRQTGRYTVPYPAHTRISLVDVRDVAEVAARVLIEPDHLGATYELVGTAPLSQSEVVETIGASLGQTISATEVPLEEWEAGARQSGMSAYAVETLLQMFRYYATYGLVGNANVLRWLLGREPRSLGDFVQEMAVGA
jgi:uncharacterized protein YbjT (DUF2867 family)